MNLSPTVSTLAGLQRCEQRATTGCCSTSRQPHTSSYRHTHASRHSHILQKRISRSTHDPHRLVRLTATQKPVSNTGAEDVALVESMIEFLKEDLTHLFDDQGIDTSKYDETVMFEDPITKYDSIQGYVNNIRFLKTVFNPQFILRDIRRTAPYEITTRWTMTMKPTFVDLLGPLGKLWSPDLVFTGTSVMGINPQTGRFNKHVDTWDAVDQQGYFSIEAFIHMLSQVMDVRGIPRELETPDYQVLVKRRDYEVREYSSIMVCETDNSSPTGSFTAFGSLAGYIFGKNKESMKMDMTTPVFSNTEKMQFYIPNTIEKAPEPEDGSPVSLATIPKQIFAVSRFGGIASDADGKRRAAMLERILERDGLNPEKDKYILARYNDPGTLPPFRRNEVLVPLKNYTLPRV